MSTSSSARRGPVRHDPGFQHAYISIIDGLRARGLKIYGLWRPRSHARSPEDKLRGAEPGQQICPWIDRYVQTYVQISSPLRARVDVFEAVQRARRFPRRQQQLDPPRLAAVR
ncbi:MAG: hypothetical protein R2856_26950 [Caldilineaceae bacterium]